MRKLISNKIDKVMVLIEVISRKLDLDFKMEKENKKYLQFGGGNSFVTFKIWYYSKELEKDTFVKIQINYIEKLNYAIKEIRPISIIPKNFEKDFSFLAKEDSELLLKSIKVKAYDLREILLEKVRAILTRRGIKSRDFIDVFLILQKEKLNLHDFRKEILNKITDMLRFDKY